MYSAYIPLFLTVFFSLLTRNKAVILIGIIISSVVAFSYGVVDILGIVSIAAFAFISNMYFKIPSIKNFYKLSFLVATLSFALLFSFHIIPGFHNYQVGKKIMFSDNSCYFSLFLNFDKVTAALILFYMSNLPEKEEMISSQSFINSILILMISSSFILIPSMLFGYVDFEPKIPSIALIWLLNNLFFVSFSEEVILRGVFQNYIKELTNHFKINYIHIYITAFIFGILHFQGGILYVFLSTIAGFFYGYAYDKTKKLSSSIIVHFGVNTIHFFLFTYPANIKFCA